MSHFYADIRGNRGGVSRGGTKNSGIEGHIRGWNTGIYVEIGYDEISKKDVVKVYRTGGTNNPKGELIVEFSDGHPTEHKLTPFKDL